MNKLLPLTLLLSASISAYSQKLILQPQIGVRTFNYVSNSDVPWNTKILPSASVGARLMYLSKNGHGPYLGFHANSLIIRYVTGSTNSISYTLTTYEAGYQWLSKPVYFKKIWDNSFRGEDLEALDRKGWAVQFMPSIGLSYTRPLARGYSADEMKLGESIGLTTGLSLWLSKNGKQLFSFNVSYTAALTGNLYDSHRNNSATMTDPYLRANGSGFNVGIGVPINLLKKK